MDVRIKSRPVNDYLLYIQPLYGETVCCTMKYPWFGHFMSIRLRESSRKSYRDHVT